MPTLLATEPSKPHGDEAIPRGTFGYLEARNKYLAHNLVLREFEQSQISKATLARRMNLSPAQVSRLLGAPGNWTLDTLSNLIFAICGGEPEYEVAFPLDDAPRNDTDSEWQSSNDFDLRATTGSSNEAHGSFKTRLSASSSLAS